MIDFNLSKIFSKKINFYNDVIVFLYLLHFNNINDFYRDFDIISIGKNLVHVKDKDEKYLIIEHAASMTYLIHLFVFFISGMKIQKDSRNNNLFLKILSTNCIRWKYFCYSNKFLNKPKIKYHHIFMLMKMFCEKEISENLLKEMIFNKRNNRTSIDDCYSDLQVLSRNTNNAHSKNSSKNLERSQKLDLDVKKMRNILLLNHNKYRELHAVPPLKHSNELEKSAQAWAQVLSEVLVLTYSPESPVYTENCAEIRNPFQFETEEITDLWYSQERNYDYENFNHSGPVDQFCVLIWKESLQVGFGIASSNDLRIFVVAHYSPPALLTDFEENVRRPKNYIKPSIKSKPFMPVEPTSKSFKAIKKEELHDFHMDALGKLNNFRILHGVPLLKLNDTLCLDAFDQAKRCATNKRIMTNNNKSVGETFLELKIESFSVTGGLSPRHWYGESVGYDYSKEPDNDQYHNFTQLVWKDSQEMGIGVAASLDGILFVIGKYLPPGNIQNQYLANVLQSNEKNQPCHCGCGYIAPSCIQDLKTTIIGKLPSMMSNMKSKDSKMGISGRSFSVIENKFVQNADQSIKESHVTKAASSTKEKSLKNDLEVLPTKESQLVQSNKTKDTLRSVTGINTVSNIESIHTKDPSIEDLEDKKPMVKETINKTVTESIASKKSDIILEVGRSNIESIKNKESLSKQNTINAKQSSKEMTQSQKDSIKTKQSNVVSEQIRSKIESVKSKDTSQIVTSTNASINASLKESIKSKPSGVKSEIVRSNIESVKVKDSSQIVSKNDVTSINAPTNPSLKESIKPKSSEISSKIVRSKIESVNVKDTSQIVTKNDATSANAPVNTNLKESIKQKTSDVTSEIVRSKIESVKGRDESALNKVPSKEITNLSLKESQNLKQSEKTSGLDSTKNNFTRIK